MTARRRLLFLLLAAVWGGSFLFIRVSVDAFGPLALSCARCLVGALALVAWARLRGQPLRATRGAGAYLRLGLLAGVIPFGLMAAAEVHLTAGLTAILIATTPILSIPLARLDGERLPPLGPLGLALGLTGVALVAGGGVPRLDRDHLLGVLAALGAAAGLAASGMYAGRAFVGEQPLVQAARQQLAAGLVLLPLAVLDPPPRGPHAGEALAVLALGVLSSGLGYVIFFGLIGELGATRALLVEFLVPVFAAVWGALFLGERLSPLAILGAALILTGCALVVRPAASRPSVGTSG